MSVQEEMVTRNLSNGILIDTNLLLLFLIGRTNIHRISHFKRTQSYTVRHYEVLQQFVAPFLRYWVTPHLIAETSNLALLDRSGADSSRLRTLLRDYVIGAQETYEESRMLVQTPFFERLGITDAAIVLAGQHPMLVLTDDGRLYQALAERGVDTFLFRHLMA